MEPIKRLIMFWGVRKKMNLRFLLTFPGITLGKDSHQQIVRVLQKRINRKKIQLILKALLNQMTTKILTHQVEVIPIKHTTQLQMELAQEQVMDHTKFLVICMPISKILIQEEQKSIMLMDHKEYTQEDHLEEVVTM